MVADVPLGAFLSGGIDSTIIVGLMQRGVEPARARRSRSGSTTRRSTRAAYAELAARHLGTEHHAFIVEPRAWETLPALAWQFDEPFADSSALPTWYVARETRREVTVALTGDAGDELFAGYDRYRAVALAEPARPPAGRPARFLGGPLARALPASARAKTRLRRVRRWLEGIGERPETRYLALELPVRRARPRRRSTADDLIDALASAGAGGPRRGRPGLGARPRPSPRRRTRDPVTRAMVADLLTYLPGDLLVKVDMASMAHSLECRGPFLDHRVVELALALPIRRKLRLRGGRSKVVLKQAFADLLPPAIRHRPKMGFGVPIDRWFRGELKDELRAVLLDPVASAAACSAPRRSPRWSTSTSTAGATTPIDSGAC